MSQIEFSKRPTLVIPEHRRLYKIAHISLVLSMCSRSGKSSLARLQLFNWALKTGERRRLLIDAAGKSRLNVPVWGFDPALIIAVKYSVAEGLIRHDGNGYALTAAGESFSKRIRADNEVLFEDKEFFSVVGKKITEAMVDQVAKSWRD